MIESQRAAHEGRGLTEGGNRKLRKAGVPALAAGLLVASLLAAAAGVFWVPAKPLAAVANPGRAVEAAADGNLRSFSYYPEQLAALNSLNHFEPMADSRRQAAPRRAGPPLPFPRPAAFATVLAPAATAPVPAPGEGKPHRVLAAARLGAVGGLTPEAAVASPISPAQNPAEKEKIVVAAGPQIFGVTLPAMPSVSLPTVSLPTMSLPNLAGLPGGEAAIGGLAGLGAQVAKLWR